MVSINWIDSIHLYVGDREDRIRTCFKEVVTYQDNFGANKDSLKSLLSGN